MTPGSNWSGAYMCPPALLRWERLEGALPQVLEEYDGGYRIKGAEALTPHVVSWRPRLSSNG